MPLPDPGPPKMNTTRNGVGDDGDDEEEDEEVDEVDDVSDNVS